jgi:hypothetical protein
MMKKYLMVSLLSLVPLLNFGMPRKVDAGEYLLVNKVLAKEDMEMILRGPYTITFFGAALWKIKYPYPECNPEVQKQRLYHLLAFGVQVEKLKGEVKLELEDPMVQAILNEDMVKEFKEEYSDLRSE